MAIPDFVVEMRRLIGKREMWVPAVTAVVRRPAEHGDGTEILLVRRADNGRWGPVTGILDPREEPATGAAGETMEETGVTIRVDRLVSTSVDGPVTHVNGDVASYLDVTFACSWVSGEAHVADDESSEVAWVRSDALPDMRPALRSRIEAALDDGSPARFLV